MTRVPYIINNDNIIFSLDVGTRTIIGLLCYPENGNLRVLNVEIEEHPERNMLDGQIHNIEGVVKTARQVKEKLEKKMNIKLSRVSVAAAGRALTTIQVKSERDLSPEHRVLPEEILGLELEAVKKAQENLAENLSHGQNSHYCVGYSTVQYLLDDHPISSLVSQKGYSMGVEILATFLPNAVVDSLLTVVEKLGLSLDSLTLEPIAAIQALIPPEYRLLNIALVDIGAGTSDIAITNKGSIIAYAMVPLAGDEITEKLSDHYLLDFTGAENLKIQLSTTKGQYCFKDIIGNEIKASRDEILEVIDPVIDEIAEYIVKSILHYNQTPPRALFCIGGGSKTPLLKEKFAEKLNLPLERIAVRDFSSLKRIIYSGKKLKGPECITPMGIALSSLNEKYFGFSYVTVNGKVIRLLETEPTNIGRALLVAGYSPRSLIGLRGSSKKITINGHQKIYPGKPGNNAVIKVNGKLSNLETIISPNDDITIESATPGEDARITVKEVINEDNFFVYIKNKRKNILPRISVNDKPVDWDHELFDGDIVNFNGLGTIADLSKIYNISIPEVDNLTINGKPADFSSKIKTADSIEW